jgi:hypothetical protein
MHGLAQNQKRELETRFIVEAKLGGKANHASRSLNSRGELDARSETSEQSDTDLENDDAADEIDGCATCSVSSTVRYQGLSSLLTLLWSR